jgi:trans-aconitate 2-methyltransferase
MSSSSTPSQQPSANDKKKDWSATQYLKFNNERTRPVHDLVAQIKPHLTSPNPRIYDLGCGPGNSTQVLLDAFPSAHVTGLDSSPDMLEKASAALPAVEFVQGDVSTFTPREGEKVDLLFSNAVFHWLRTPARLETLVRLFSSLQPGGVLAIQVPDNYHESSHRLMRDVATAPDMPWSEYFDTAHVAEFGDKQRPDLDPIEPPRAFYDALSPHAEMVNTWRTMYHHVLGDAGGIVEWVKGTGLMPFLARMEGDKEVEGMFLEEYERRIAGEYGALGDGRVLLGYPRFFVVAVRK